MNDKIIIKGIETNNLKDISITLEKNAINLILSVMMVVSIIISILKSPRHIS